MKKLFDKSGKLSSAIILFIIIAIALFRLFYLYSLRDGHHVDETWSYGFANSYYQSQIFGGFSKDTHINIGEWIKGDVFNDYITVSDDHRFAFDSVIYNSNSDLSPALYTLILHFICSFFPGKFSWNFAFAISVICFIPSLFLIYYLTYEFTKSRFCGYLCLVYYVFSGAGTANFLYLRVYHLFTLFSLLLLYLMVKIVKEDKHKKIFFVFLPFVTVLGCLTHFYFLVIAFCITFFSSLILLFGKRFKDFLILCLVMLLSVVLFFAVCPTAFRLIFPFVSSSGTAVSAVTGYYDFPYYFDLGAANSRFFTGCVGFSLNITVLNIVWFLGCIVFAAIIVFLIWFLFRNEKWMKALSGKVLSFINKSLTILKEFFSGFHPSVFIALLASIMYLFIIPVSATFVNMGFTERYLFNAMAFFIIVFSCFAGKLILFIYEKINRRAFSIVLTLVFICLLVFMNYRSNMYTDDFKFDYMRDNELKNQLKDRDVFVIVYSERDMVWLSTVLNSCNNVFVALQDDVLKEDYIYPEFDEDTCVLIVKTGLLTDEQVEELESDGDFVLNTLSIPNISKTLEQIISEIEVSSGNSYEEEDEFLNFLGHVSLYE